MLGIAASDLNRHVGISRNSVLPLEEALRGPGGRSGSGTQATAGRIYPAYKACDGMVSR